MKRLLFSLYLIVFIALIGLGWGIDLLYQEYSSQKTPTFEHSEQLLKSYTQLLDSTDLAVEQIELPHLVQIEAKQQFILPDSLMKDLNAGQIVILNSDEGITLHQQLTVKPFVLSLGPLTTQDEANQILLKYVFTGLFYTGIALILLFWFRPLIMTVFMLSHALKNVSLGRLDTRVSRTSLYLNELCDHFNFMAEKLERLNENNQLLSQAVSHDLRTPLARILFAVEKLKLNADHNVLLAVHKIESDVEVIEAMSKDLLDYARLGKSHELSAQQKSNTSINVDIFAEQIIAGFEHEDTNIHLALKDIYKEIKLDADLLQKILNNLISNAIRFSDSQVKVEFLLKANHLLIRVEDDGQGIDLNAFELDDYCQPFVQHKRKDKHFGIGLAIVNRATKLMGGQLSVLNHVTLSGAQFCVEVPFE